MKEYIVYIHFCKVNGKCYVGQTCQKPEKRWRKGVGYILCPHFYRAICKYGWDNFDHVIWAQGLSEQQANEMEKILIKKLSSNNPKYGYNITDGGSNGSHSLETKEKISRNHANVSGENNPQAKKVLCIETGEILWGSRAFEKKYGYKHSAISACCHGKQKTAYGYHWRLVDEGLF